MEGDTDLAQPLLSLSWHRQPALDESVHEGTTAAPVGLLPTFGHLNATSPGKRGARGTWERGSLRLWKSNGTAEFPNVYGWSTFRNTFDGKACLDDSEIFGLGPARVRAGVAKDGHKPTGPLSIVGELERKGVKVASSSFLSLLQESG